MRMMKVDHGGNDWNDREIYDFNPVKPKEMSVGLSKDDIEYAELSKRENEKLENNMGDLQKELLKKLEDGSLMKKSELIEVNEQ